MKLIYGTGISKGLGKALFEELISDDQNFIIGLGRSFTSDQIKMSNLPNKKVKMVYYDFSETPNIKGDELYLDMDFEEIIFINNAGSIEPIKKVGNLGAYDLIQRHIRINFITPIYLINNIISNKKPNIKVTILNITSGAAESQIPGWSLYTSTKKGVKTFFDVLGNEEPNINIHHIDPGVMDTNMQEMIRNSNEQDFPSIKKFNDYYLNGQLKSPNEVAKSIIKEYL